MQSPSVNDTSFRSMVGKLLVTHPELERKRERNPAPEEDREQEYATRKLIS